ncbi:hypothetical protein RFI_35872 [Reticulomyxa filosa]|uniref:Uncharacterized protein n=1 Tax=Reticulomyxa filosa TaxID=46433 RepID=X6LHY4_RETFI|nr:hypothetical protein RFI_35872 [Reticulomyxa filosa]|eukprot:ETO01568.1 hypothetical protein RFI_35872 [Reticulomyxa filosa]
MDLSIDFRITESEVLEGKVYSALVFINACCSTILLQLLRSLEHFHDRKAAQAIARIATCIANQWNSNANTTVKSLIADSVDNLETAHEGLRTWTLTQWSIGSLSGHHIQTLLELLLSSRSVIPKEEKVVDEKEQKKIPENILEAFTKFRDGPSKCTMITLMYEQALTSRTLAIKPDPHNRYFVDDFVADICVRG